MKFGKRSRRYYNLGMKKPDVLNYPDLGEAGLVSMLEYALYLGGKIIQEDFGIILDHTV